MGHLVINLLAAWGFISLVMLLVKYWKKKRDKVKDKLNDILG
jgi:hypothetical protein